MNRARARGAGHGGGRGPAPGARFAALALGLALVTVGCGVEVKPGRPRPTSAKKEQVLREGEGTWDLRTAPGRGEAGMPAGEAYVIYEGRSSRAIRARVLLPKGRRLDTRGRRVAFDSYGASCPKRTRTSAPTTMDISVGPVPLAEARDELLRAAEQLGFARRHVEEWYARAAGGAGSTGVDDRVRSSIPRSEVGYLKIEAQGRFRPTGDTADTAVHYTLSWSEPFDPDACTR